MGSVYNKEDDDETMANGEKMLCFVFVLYFIDGDFAASRLGGER